MQLANCRLRLHTSEVPKTGITPAELLVLKTAHMAGAGGDPILDLTITGQTVKRTAAEEIERLRNRYPNLRYRKGNDDVNVVNDLFPGAAANVPLTFAAIGVANQGGAPAGPQSYNPEPKVDGALATNPPADAPKATADDDDND